MKFRYLIFLSIFSIISIQLAFSDTKSWLKSTYKVKQVFSGDRFAIDFNGISLVVKLVHVEVADIKASKKYLKKIILNKKITVVPEEAMGLSDQGFQQVYAFIKRSGKRIFVNESLIKKGYVKYVPGKTEKFKKFISILEKTSRKFSKKEEKKESSEHGFFSELYSKKYCKESCRWVKMMNPQSRIKYDAYATAEKAGKVPCSLCMHTRLKAYRLEKRSKKKNKKQTNVASSSSKKKISKNKIVGFLFGYKNKFYSPTSKKLAQFPFDELVKYASLKEAKLSKKKPDSSSLRIGNPVLPPPMGKECIGRALPLMRPCRQESNHPTGLCEPCLQGKGLNEI